MCNQHENRIHLDIHTRILIVVPSDSHCFTMSICLSFSNKNSIRCLRAAAPCLKNYEKISFVEYCWKNCVAKRSQSFFGPQYQFIIWIFVVWLHLYVTLFLFSLYILNAIIFVDFTACSFMVTTCQGRTILSTKQPASTSSCFHPIHYSVTNKGAPAQWVRSAC